jgi:hypothetical protein
LRDARRGSSLRPHGSSNKVRAKALAVIEERVASRAADLAPTTAELQASGATFAGHRGWIERARHPDSARRGRVASRAGRARARPDRCMTAGTIIARRHRSTAQRRRSQTLTSGVLLPSGSQPGVGPPSTATPSIDFHPRLSQGRPRLPHGPPFDFVIDPFWICKANVSSRVYRPPMMRDILYFLFPLISAALVLGWVVFVTLGL